MFDFINMNFTEIVCNHAVSTSQKTQTVSIIEKKSVYIVYRGFR
jgi:hypothetical protein